MPLFSFLAQNTVPEKVYDKKEKSSSAEESTPSGRCIQGEYPMTADHF